MIGTTVTLVLVQPGLPAVECTALVLHETPDDEGVPARRALNVAYVSPLETDMTAHGRALKTLRNVPHQDCVNPAAPFRDTHHWR